MGGKSAPGISLRARMNVALLIHLLGNRWESKRGARLCAPEFVSPTFLRRDPTPDTLDGSDVRMTQNVSDSGSAHTSIPVDPLYPKERSEHPFPSPSGRSAKPMPRRARCASCRAALEFGPRENPPAARGAIAARCFRQAGPEGPEGLRRRGASCLRFDRINCARRSGFHGRSAATAAHRTW